MYDTTSIKNKALVTACTIELELLKSKIAEAQTKLNAVNNNITKQCNFKSDVSMYKDIHLKLEELRDLAEYRYLQKIDYTDIDYDHFKYLRKSLLKK